MEMYVNAADRKVYLDVPVEPTNNTVDVTVYQDGVLVHTFSTVASEPDARLSVTIPYALVASERELTVHWNFDYIEDATPFTFESTDYVSVVTPYLTPAETKVIFPNATNEERAEVEAAVRHIVNAHTGQKFGYATKTISVEGHGEDALRLPERLVELKGISTLSSILNPAGAIVVSDGWYLKKAWLEEISVQDSDNQYWGDWRDGAFDNNIYSDPDGDGRPPIFGPLGSRPGGIMVAPGTSGGTTPWKNDYPFEITGDWGYKTIPAPVKEAAKLLFNDYACMEITYRDRYLDAIKAADWRLEFNSNAWAATGNVRADQLLSEYVILDWAVI